MHGPAVVAVTMAQTELTLPARINAEKGQKKTRKRVDHGQSYMWINSKIIESSQIGSTIGDLVHTITEHLYNMNLVNLTTAVHRLGKMVAHDAKAQAQLTQLPILSELLTLIANALSSTNARKIQPQSLSNILWALASIRVVDAQVISQVCKQSLPNIDRFKLFELTTLLWALAKLSSIERAASLDLMQLRAVFDCAGQHIVHHARSMDCRCLSMVVWAYATAKQENTKLFAVAATQITKGPTPSCQEMANTIWAYGTKAIMNHDLFTSLAQKAIPNLAVFKAQELSNMIWGFASTGFFHELFYQQVAAIALSKALSPQHLANILWAFTRVCPKHPLTQHTVLSFLPVCRQQMHTFKSQEISSVALSVAKAFSLLESEKPHHLPSAVNEFFRSLSKVRYCLSDFSTQSLANMANALILVQFFDDALLLNLGREAIDRACFMEAADLFRFFRVYLSAQGASQDCASVALLLVPPLAERLFSLRPHDIKALSSSCSDFLCDSNRQDLLELCAEIVKDAPLLGACTQGSDIWRKTAVCESKLEASSVAETEEPGYASGYAFSEQSDSEEEDTESNRIVSDAERKMNQQELYVHRVGCAPAQSDNLSADYLYRAMPMQEHIHHGSFDPSQQKLAFPTNKGSNNGLDWASPVPAACVESITGKFSKLTERPLPPPSFSLWNVGEACDISISSSPPKSSGLDEKSATDRVCGGDSSLFVAQLLAKVKESDCGKLAVSRHRLQQEATDSTSKVVVKNTFIECQHSGRQCVSAVKFCSEQTRSRRLSNEYIGNHRRAIGSLGELPVPDDAFDTDDGF